LDSISRTNAWNYNRIRVLRRNSTNQAVGSSSTPQGGTEVSPGAPIPWKLQVTGDSYGRSTCYCILCHLGVPRPIINKLGSGSAAWSNPWFFARRAHGGQHNRRCVPWSYPGEGGRGTESVFPFRIPAGLETECPGGHRVITLSRYSHRQLAGAGRRRRVWHRPRVSLRRTALLVVVPAGQPAVLRPLNFGREERMDR